MSEAKSQNTKPEKTNVISFVDRVKTRYYGTEFRELTIKVQEHLQAAMYFNFNYQKAKEEFEKPVTGDA